MAVALLFFGLLGGYGLHRLDANDGAAIAALNSLEKSARSVNLARLAQASFQEQTRAWKDLVIHATDGATVKNHAATFASYHQETQDKLEALKNLALELRLNPAKVDVAIGAQAKVLAKSGEALRNLSPAVIAARQAADKLMAGVDREAAQSLEAMAETMVWENHRLQDSLASELGSLHRDATAKTALCLIVAVLVLGAACFPAMRALTAWSQGNQPFLATSGLFEPQPEPARHASKSSPTQPPPKATCQGQGRNKTEG